MNFTHYLCWRALCREFSICAPLVVGIKSELHHLLPLIVAEAVLSYGNATMLLFSTKSSLSNSASIVKLLVAPCFCLFAFVAIPTWCRKFGSRFLAFRMGQVEMTVFPGVFVPLWATFASFITYHNIIYAFDNLARSVSTSVLIIVDIRYIVA